MPTPASDPSLPSGSNGVPAWCMLDRAPVLVIQDDGSGADAKRLRAVLAPGSVVRLAAARLAGGLLVLSRSLEGGVATTCLGVALSNSGPNGGR